MKITSLLVATFRSQDRKGKVSNKMLIFPIEELPILPKGKGNKLVSISSKAFKDKSEFMMDVCCLAEDSKLHIHHEGKLVVKLGRLKNWKIIFPQEQSEVESCQQDITE